MTGSSDVSPSWTLGGVAYSDNIVTGEYTDGSVTSTITIDPASLGDDGDYVCSYQTLTQTYTLDVYGE